MRFVWRVHACGRTDDKAWGLSGLNVVDHEDVMYLVRLAGMERPGLGFSHGVSADPEAALVPLALSSGRNLGNFSHGSHVSH